MATTEVDLTQFILDRLAEMLTEFRFEDETWSGEVYKEIASVGFKRKANGELVIVQNEE